ncbi:hypothetical protein ZWY2020_009280 [Hordeum vulgare]|nr:hypothetical protein ZWY2020_009280 [Hordeum vulgare]
MPVLCSGIVVAPQEHRGQGPRATRPRAARVSCRRRSHYCIRSSSTRWRRGRGTPRSETAPAPGASPASYRPRRVEPDPGVQGGVVVALALERQQPVAAGRLLGVPAQRVVCRVEGKGVRVAVAPRCVGGYEDGAPVSAQCGCIGDNSFVNVTGDTFYAFALIGFENLTTPDVIQELNPQAVFNKLNVSQLVTVPLFCLCPTPTERSAGVQQEITYMWQPVDTMSWVSKLMGSDARAIAAANNVSADFTSTTMLQMLIPVVRPSVLPGADTRDT